MTAEHDKFPEWVKVGAKFRDETSPDDERHDVWHDRAFVEGNVVMRRWRAVDGLWALRIMRDELDRR